MNMKFTLLMAFAIIIATVEASANQTCIDQCHQTTPGQAYNPSCCDCCDSQNCHGNQIFSTCCTDQEDFCGCISGRAFCSGNVYNATYPTESPFGTCYPKGYGTCTYDPTPNAWIVCPTGRTGCLGSNNIKTCCAADETCNNADGTCTPATPPSSSSPPSNPPSNMTCLEQCQQTKPSQVYAPSCCDCCPQSQCNGNQIFTTCCAADEDFCGCTSGRAFCSGNVYNGTYPTESPFGTCYPKGYGTCTYEPSPNAWIVCPTGRSACIGSNNINTCCAAGETCNNLEGTCASASPNPSASASTSASASASASVSPSVSGSPTASASRGSTGPIFTGPITTVSRPNPSNSASNGPTSSGDSVSTGVSRGSQSATLPTPSSQPTATPSSDANPSTAASSGSNDSDDTATQASRTSPSNPNEASASTPSQDGVNALGSPAGSPASIMSIGSALIVVALAALL